jgi:hypothetical protein
MQNNSLAWKLGLHPSINFSSTSSFKNYVPIGPFKHLEKYYLQLTTL